MTALDTNVIVRYLVGDHPEQAEAARVLLEGLIPGNPGFICREVVMEVGWVLERAYRFTRRPDCRGAAGPHGFGQPRGRACG